MYNYSLDTGINPPPSPPFQIVGNLNRKATPQKGHKTDTTDYRPILLLPVTEELQVKIWRPAFYILNHDKSQMEVLSKSNVKLLLLLQECYIHFTIKPAMFFVQLILYLYFYDDFMGHKVNYKCEV
jgi:hypothetical protein